MHKYSDRYEMMCFSLSGNNYIYIGIATSAEN